MEIFLVIFLVIFFSVILISLVLALGYFYGQNKTQKDWLARYELDLPKWQDKALIRHGSSPINKVPVPKIESQEITPKVVHRGQLEARQKDILIEPLSTPIDIHTPKVSYDRVGRDPQETVEKAREIIGR